MKTDPKSNMNTDPKSSQEGAKNPTTVDKRGRNWTLKPAKIASQYKNVWKNVPTLYNLLSMPEL